MNNDKPEKLKEEVDIVDACLVVYQRRYLILKVTIFISILSVIHQQFIAPEIFRSEAKILLSSSSSGASLLGQLGGLATMVGVEAPNRENTLEIFLKSRSLTEEIVTRLDLEKKWKLSFQKAVIGARKKLLVSTSKKDGLISVSWLDEDSEFAQKVVLEALEIASEKMVAHSAGKKSLQLNFLEKRVEESREDLRKAEEDLKKFQLDSQGIEIQRQAQAIINQIQLLKDEKINKEVELNVSRGFISKDSREIKLLELTIEELKEKIDTLVGKEKKELSGYEIQIDERSLMDIPKIGLEFARKLRQVKLNQKIYGILLEQLEMAKIEARKESQSFEIIDSPIAPEVRESPKKTMAVLLSGLAAMILSVIYILFSNFIHEIKEKKGYAYEEENFS